MGGALFIDIPSGWLKGFPKQVPREFTTVDVTHDMLRLDPLKFDEYREWLTEQNGGKEVEGFCRFFVMEVEDE